MFEVCEEALAVKRGRSWEPSVDETLKQRKYKMRSSQRDCLLKSFFVLKVALRSQEGVRFSLLPQLGRRNGPVKARESVAEKNNHAWIWNPGEFELIFSPDALKTWE